MIYIYRFLLNIIFIISPLIILIRLIKKKEDPKRFLEKFCFFSKKRVPGKVIWFHGASVGELQSIIPLLERLEKKNNIRQILITSNTVSSSKIIGNFKSKKVIHQFFPIDTNFHSKKFIDYWNPSLVFFIDSEIWPNMICNLNERKISVNLINARITKKSFKRWKLFPNFSKKIFKKFDLCLSSSKESQSYCKKLGLKSPKFFGNLKFSQSENENVSLKKNIQKFLKKRIVWCASSTHETEEKLCGNIHNELKKSYKNLLTIIIPRHINRAQYIKNELENINLKVHSHNSEKKINKETDIYLVDVYGLTKSFFNISKNIFLGGSIINHGGQNPLEATRYGCNVIHGPHVSNFKEIYNFLKKNKISYKISNQPEMLKVLKNLFSKNDRSKKVQKKLFLIGQEVLKRTYDNVDLLIKNETSKT